MKIGDFARKYNLNITTIRYYVDKALLTPERKNNQYIFNRACMEDMEKILTYKEYRFSLEEIELLFFLEKASRFRDETVLQIISQLLTQKKAQPQSLANFRLDHPNFSPERMTFSRLKSDLKNVEIQLTLKKEIGSTTGSEKHFPRHEAGEQLSVLGYKAIKSLPTKNQ